MENGNNYSWRSRHHNNNRNHHHDTTPSATDCDDESDDTKVSEGRYFQPSDKFTSNGSVSKAKRCNATTSLAEAVTLMPLSSSSDDEDGEKCEKDMKLGDISEDEDEEDLEEEEQVDIESGRTQSKSAEIMFMMLAHSDRVKQKISSDTSVITKNTKGLSSVPDQSKASRSLEHIRARYGRPKTEDKSSASLPRASELHRNVDDGYDDGDNEEKPFLILNDKKTPKADVTMNEELAKASRSKSNLPSVSLTETTRDKTVRPSSVIADIRNARSGINRKTENSSASPADSRRPIFYFDEDKNLVISKNGPINVSTSVHRMAETANSSCEQDNSTRVLPIGGGSSDTTMKYEENNDDDDDDDCDPEGHVIREYWRLAQNPPEYSEIQKYQPGLVGDERVSLPGILSSRTQSRQRSLSSYPDTTENNSMASATANSQEIRMPIKDTLMSTGSQFLSCRPKETLVYRVITYKKTHLPPNAVVTKDQNETEDETNNDPAPVFDLHEQEPEPDVYDGEVQENRDLFKVGLDHGIGKKKISKKKNEKQTTPFMKAFIKRATGPSKTKKKTILLRQILQWISDSKYTFEYESEMILYHATLGRITHATFEEFLTYIHAFAEKHGIDYMEMKEKLIFNA